MLHQGEAGRVWGRRGGGRVVDLGCVGHRVHRDYRSCCRVVSWPRGWGWGWEEGERGDFEEGLLVGEKTRRGGGVVRSGEV